MPRHTKIVAIVFEAKGDHDRAIADFTKAIEINPHDAEAYYNRGIANQVKGDRDLAIADYTRALEIKPRHARAHYNRAAVYQANGEKLVGSSNPGGDFCRGMGIVARMGLHKEIQAISLNTNAAQGGRAVPLRTLPLKSSLPKRQACHGISPWRRSLVC